MSDKLNLKNLYTGNYFSDRVLNDQRRVKSFKREKKIISELVNTSGVCLDVGCGTGEFLTAIEWAGRKYGIEISEYAAREALSAGIEIVEKFEKPESLDAVFFRGTIQHLDSPFRSLQKAVNALKSDGVIFFVATPNAASIYYRLFQNLPALDEARNFFVPSSNTLKSIMKMHGLECVLEDYPYWSSPYANFFLDHLRFVLKIATSPFSERAANSIEFPFWGSMMNLAFKKVAAE